MIHPALPGCRYACAWAFQKALTCARRHQHMVRCAGIAKSQATQQSVSSHGEVLMSAALLCTPVERHDAGCAQVSCRLVICAKMASINQPAVQ